jgi:hypothetical protein
MNEDVSVEMSEASSRQEWCGNKTIDSFILFFFGLDKIWAIDIYTLYIP